MTGARLERWEIRSGPGKPSLMCGTLVMDGVLAFVVIPRAAVRSLVGRQLVADTVEQMLAERDEHGKPAALVRGRVWEGLAVTLGTPHPEWLAGRIATGRPWDPEHPLGRVAGEDKS